MFWIEIIGGALGYWFIAVLVWGSTKHAKVFDDDRDMYVAASILWPLAGVVAACAVTIMGIVRFLIFPSSRMGLRVADGVLGYPARRKARAEAARVAREKALADEARDKPYR